MRERAAAYVEFARNRPELFRLMFMFRPNAIAIEADNELGAATDVFEAGLDDVRQAIADGSLVDRDPIQITLTLWAAIPWRRHGVDRGPASCRCGRGRCDRCDVSRAPPRLTGNIPRRATWPLIDTVA